MPQEIQNWFRQHTFLIWLATIVFGGGGTYYQLNDVSSRMQKWEPKIEKISQHQLLIEQLRAQNTDLRSNQAQSTDRIILKMDSLIDQLGTQNKTMTAAVQALAIDVSVLKEKHSKD